MVRYIPSLLLALLLASSGLGTCYGFTSHAKKCKPSGHLKGKAGKCNRDHESECCEAGKKYPRYRCSPPVTGATIATMTINGFGKGKDGGGPAECDNKYHKDTEKIVALSTGWYDKGTRCGKKITIHANGNSVQAKVIDECDSVNGCDAEHDFQPPCPYNIVDASQAVWDALDLDSQIGEYNVTWSDS